MIMQMLSLLFLWLFGFGPLPELMGRFLPDTEGMVGGEFFLNIFLTTVLSQCGFSREIFGLLF